jgi:F-type H+-transporting ATPase subunit gamma
MEKLADVRKRMASVQGIGEVCRTLATVASAKLARTHERARGARLYTARLREILARQQAASRVAGRDPAALSPLMGARPAVTRIELLVVGADRGLCGGYNLALGREARRFAAEKTAESIAVSAVVKGRRAETYLRRATDIPMDEASGWTRAGVTAAEVDGLLDSLTARFLGREVDEVWACYTAFISTMRREPTVVRLLPVMPPESAAESARLAALAPDGWFYEPAQQPCVEELLRAFVRLQIEDVLLEAFASEQAARMVTMQEASERADRALAEQRVHYNRLRRESITADLVGVLVAGRVRKEAEAS